MDVATVFWMVYNYDLGSTINRKPAKSGAAMGLLFTIGCSLLSLSRSPLNYQSAWVKKD